MKFPMKMMKTMIINKIKKICIKKMIIMKKLNIICDYNKYNTMGNLLIIFILFLKNNYNHLIILIFLF